MKKKVAIKQVSQLRRDPVTRDWIVIATGRGKRPNEFAGSQKMDAAYITKKNCPFEDPHAHGNDESLLILDRNRKELRKNSDDCFVQVVPSK